MIGAMSLLKVTEPEGRRTYCSANFSRGHFTTTMDAMTPTMANEASNANQWDFAGREDLRLWDLAMLTRKCDRHPGFL